MTAILPWGRWVNHRIFAYGTALQGQFCDYKIMLNIVINSTRATI